MSEEVGNTFCTECQLPLELIELVPKVSHASHLQDEQDWFYGLHCDKCKKCPFLMCEKSDLNEFDAFEKGSVQKNLLQMDENNFLIKIDDLLQTSNEGWFIAKNDFERFQSFLLNNAVHTLEEPPDMDKPEEKETLFSLPFQKDQVWLFADQGKVAGFAVLKLKGIESCENDPSLINIMEIVDAIFIRKSSRRKGACREFLTLLFQNFDRIGFSQPISRNLTLLLENFLKDDLNAKYQDSIWIMAPDLKSSDNFWEKRGTLGAKATEFDNNLQFYQDSYS
eukprot:TRINITY_DN15946_c0_g1_i3.p1 TRINITY_DN15946_c0_g1~~TRINITY_DN15946_c0_g1_i3.p1  ORF type:complete len:280 (-),score=26.58 TRINITY_DN15946_c0_g1_i3:5-844(-)